MFVPKEVDPIKFARQQVHLVGELNLKDCPRIQKIADQGSGLITIDLQFSRNDRGRYVVTGCCDAKIQLVCQRCSQPVEKQVIVDVSLCVVLSDSQAKNLPAEYDPLLSTGEPVSLIALVEDELLLGLPMAPMHEKGKCPVEFPGYFVQ